jgi:hypothetical protein
VVKVDADFADEYPDGDPTCTVLPGAEDADEGGAEDADVGMF